MAAKKTEDGTKKMTGRSKILPNGAKPVKSFLTFSYVLIVSRLLLMWRHLYPERRHIPCILI